MRTKLILFLGLCAMSLTSCTLFKSIAKETDRTLDKIQANLERPFAPSSQYKMDTISVKDEIWLGNTSVRVNEGDALPSRFESDEGIRGKVKG